MDIVGTEGMKWEPSIFPLQVHSWQRPEESVWQKHGNRSVSSKSGAADVLECLGVKLALTADQAGAVLEQTGMCFLFAPAYHSSMKYAAPVRKEIGIRSIFNILGPLSNPAGASMQLLGVYSRELVEPLAQVLANLGVKRGMVVCGGDGLDEATLTGPTHVCEIRFGQLSSYDMTPEELGLTACKLEELIGGTPQENAAITRDILSGRLTGPKRMWWCSTQPSAYIWALMTARLRTV